MSRVRISYKNDEGTPLPAGFLAEHFGRRRVYVDDADPTRVEEAMQVVCDRIGDIASVQERSDYAHDTQRAAYRAWITFSRAVPGCTDDWIKDRIRELLWLHEEEWAQTDIHVVPGARPKFEIVMHRRIAQSAL